MSIEPGTYAVGPESGTLSVRTGKGGAAARAGHNLLIEVGRWGATVQLAADPSQSLLELTADSRSLRVLDGTGGMTTLGDDDKSGITQTIDEEVLKGTAIVFRSTSVQSSGEGHLRVQGDLELAGGVNPVTFELELGDDGRVRGTATVKQTAWGVKPYSALFGTLKVADEVEVEIDARLIAAG
jgi:polyisoprenoid-binding protein YceI